MFLINYAKQKSVFDGKLHSPNRLPKLSTLSHGLLQWQLIVNNIKTWAVSVHWRRACDMVESIGKQNNIDSEDKYNFSK